MPIIRAALEKISTVSPSCSSVRLSHSVKMFFALIDIPFKGQPIQLITDIKNLPVIKPAFPSDKIAEPSSERTKKARNVRR